jgi:hypothetical protein
VIPLYPVLVYAEVLSDSNFYLCRFLRSWSLAMVSQNGCKRRSSRSCTVVTFLVLGRVSNSAQPIQCTVLQVKAGYSIYAHILRFVDFLCTLSQFFVTCHISKTCLCFTHKYCKADFHLFPIAFSCQTA